MNGQGSFWDTASNVEQLRHLVAEKQSANKISAKLGVSRNSIISKCKRLGITLCGGSAPKAVTASSAKPSSNYIAGRRPAPVVCSAAAEVFEISRCSLEDLDDACCHWVVGDPSAMRYCGDKVSNPKIPWCSKHANMVFEAPPSSTSTTGVTTL